MQGILLNVRGSAHDEAREVFELIMSMPPQYRSMIMLGILLFLRVAYVICASKEPCCCCQSALA